MSRSILRILDVLCLAAVASSCAYVAWNWSAIPAVVPIHFGFHGRPDGWGPRWTIWFVPALAVLLLTGLSLVRRMPERFSFPVRITEENRPRQLRLAVLLVDQIRLVIALLLAFLTVQQVRVSLKLTDGLGVVPMAAFVGALLGTIAVYAVRASRAA
jgi:hypothetical protein